VRADYSAATTDDRGEYRLRKVTPGKQYVWVRVDDTFYQLVADLPAESVLQLPGTQTGEGSEGGGSEGGGSDDSGSDGGGSGPAARRRARTSVRPRSEQ
jgi:hypothetical protein